VLNVRRIFLETLPSVAARLERALVPLAAAADKSAIKTDMIVESYNFHQTVDDAPGCSGK
jgi:hypothetical protein